ncbi:UNVERIFIED_CONTAM: hypothetical protein IGO34_22840 [Salmonella enterica subsp. enterica serovar Weltevreden]
MAEKTQKEHLAQIARDQELLLTQQRVIIQQNDKILEFMDAVYTAMAAEAERAPQVDMTQAQPSAAEVMATLKDLTGDDDDEPRRPKASRSWGRGGN